MVKSRYVQMILVLLFVLAPLQAGTLDGVGFNFSTFLGPDQVDSINGFVPTFTPLSPLFGFYHVTIGDTTVTATDFALGLTWLPPDPLGLPFSGPANGWILSFTGAGPITGVTIGPATNVSGLVVGQNVTFTSSSITVDWVGLTFSGLFDSPSTGPVTVVQLDVTTSPEPASIALIGSGLVAVFALGRRRRFRAR